MPAAGNYNNAVSKIDIKYNTAVHLFSNILDIESIDLKKLATLIAGTGYIHYFLCTGPINSGNYRIDAFSRYFNIHDYGSIFSDFRSGQYNTLANGHTFSCQTKGFTVVRKNSKIRLAKSCIAAARLEKVILETVISGRLDINQSSWNILVVEKDVPCAALAVDDLACLFNHLTAMTRDYSGMRFPHVCLDVITGCDSIKWTSENDISFHSEQENELQQKKYDLVAEPTLPLMNILMPAT